MKFVDVEFLNKYKLIDDDYCLKEDNYLDINIPILDTKTGKQTKIKYRDLLNNPIRPFKRVNNKISILNEYRWSELFNKVLKVNDLYFVLKPEYMLMWYNGSVYFKYVTYPKDKISGFNIINKGNNLTYFVLDKDRLHLSNFSHSIIYLKSPYFIPKIDIENMIKIDIIDDMKEFKKRAKTDFYLLKVRLLS